MRIASFLCVCRALLGINLYLDDNAQLYYCVQTAIKKKNHRLGDLNDENLFSHSSAG